jgi:hypothetical protein
MKRIIMLAIAAVASLTTAAAAWAAPPPNIANTVWTVTAAGRTNELLITTQGGPGAPGASICQLISGNFEGIASIRGWYCPSTGRIHFLHNNADSGLPVRVFTGTVSDQVAGQPLTMAGTATVLASAFGDYREHGFTATE